MRLEIRKACETRPTSSYLTLTMCLRSRHSYYSYSADEETEAREARQLTQGDPAALPSPAGRVWECCHFTLLATLEWPFTLLSQTGFRGHSGSGNGPARAPGSVRDLCTGPEGLQQDLSISHAGQALATSRWSVGSDQPRPGLWPRAPDPWPQGLQWGCSMQAMWLAQQTGIRH